MNQSANKTNVLELICSKIDPMQPESNEVIDITLTASDFNSIGLTLNAGHLYLKELQQDKLIFIEKLHIVIPEDYIEDPDPEDSIDIVTMKFIEQYARDKRDGIVHEIKISNIRFDKQKSVLVLKDKEVKMSLKNDMTNAHYVMEYMFENGPTEKSYYSEIIESKFAESNLDWMAIYRACKDIQQKVLKGVKIEDLLIIKTGVSGYVQLNPRYS